MATEVELDEHDVSVVSGPVDGKYFVDDGEMAICMVVQAITTALANINTILTAMNTTLGSINTSIGNIELICDNGE